VTSSTNYLAEIEQLRTQLTEKESQLQSQSNKLRVLSSRVDILEEVVRHLKITRFMPSSEKPTLTSFCSSMKRNCALPLSLNNTRKTKIKKRSREQQKASWPQTSVVWPTAWANLPLPNGWREDWCEKYLLRQSKRRAWYRASKNPGVGVHARKGGVREHRWL